MNKSKQNPPPEPSEPYRSSVQDALRWLARLIGRTAAVEVSRDSAINSPDRDQDNADPSPQGEREGPDA